MCSWCCVLGCNGKDEMGMMSCQREMAGRRLRYTCRKTICKMSMVGQLQRQQTCVIPSLRMLQSNYIIAANPAGAWTEWTESWARKQGEICLST